MDKATGELLKEYKGHKHSQYQLRSCLSYSDAHILTGSEDHQIYIWRLVDASLVHTLKGHKKAVVCVDYHPTETCLLSASVDGSVKVWL